MTSIQLGIINSHGSTSGKSGISTKAKQAGTVGLLGAQLWPALLMKRGTALFGLGQLSATSGTSGR